MFTRFRRMNKQYLIAGGVLGVLIIGNIIGFLFMRPGPPPDSFAGKIAAVTETSLTVVDVKGRARTFAIAASTTIVMGKDVTAGTVLATSTFVMVTTDVPGPATTTAKKIRILSTDPFTRPHKGEAP